LGEKKAKVGVKVKISGKGLRPRRDEGGD